MRYLYLHSNDDNNDCTSSMGRRQPCTGAGDEQPPVNKRRPRSNDSVTVSTSIGSTNSQSNNNNNNNTINRQDEVEWIPPKNDSHIPHEVHRYSDVASTVSSLSGSSLPASFASMVFPEGAATAAATATEDSPAVETTSHSSDTTTKEDFVEAARSQIGVLQSLLEEGAVDMALLAETADASRTHQKLIESYLQEVMTEEDAGFVEEIFALYDLMRIALEQADSFLVSWLSEAPDQNDEPLGKRPAPDTGAAAPPPSSTTTSPKRTSHASPSSLRPIAEDPSSSESRSQGEEDENRDDDDDDYDSDDSSSSALTNPHHTSLCFKMLALQGDVNALLCMLRAQQLDKRLGAAEALALIATGGDNNDNDGDADNSMAPYYQKEILSCGGLSSLVDAFRRKDEDEQVKLAAAQTIAYTLESYQFSFGSSSSSSSDALRKANRILQALQCLANQDTTTMTNAATRGMIAFWFQYLEPLLQAEISQGSLLVEDEDMMSVHLIPLERRRSTGSGTSASSIDTTRQSQRVQKFLERTVLLVIQIGQMQQQRIAEGGSSSSSTTTTTIITAGGSHSWDDTVQGFLTLSRRVTVTHDVRFALDQMETLLQRAPPQLQKQQLPPPPAPPSWTVSEVESHQLNASASYAQVQANGPPRPAPTFRPLRKATAQLIANATIREVNGPDVVVVVHKNTQVLVPGGNSNSNNNNKGYWLQDLIKTCICGRVVQGRVVTRVNDDEWRVVPDELVAIKVLSLEELQERSCDDAVVLDEIETEFAAMAHVHQQAQREDASAIIATLDLCQDEESIYLVMPYCETPLFEVVKQKGRLDEATARFWFGQILEGISHLQRAGVCHRDISLENILIRDNKAVIIDFGIALRVPLERRRLRHLVQPMNVCGKASYMAPEIRRRQIFDGFAIDLWSTAVVLFILLVGNPPWNHPCDDIRYELISKQDQLASLLNSWQRPVSPEAADLLQCMLREDPCERLSLQQIRDHPWMKMES